MIRYVSGDLMYSASHFHSIAHGVNCQGVMGSGIALAIRTSMPEVYTKYRQIYETGKLKPGFVHAVSTSAIVGLGRKDLLVWNCATQNRYGRYGGPFAEVSAIRECLIKVRDWSVRNPSLVMDPVDKEDPWPPVQLGIPMIGAGLGGLSPSEVIPVFDEVFAEAEKIHVTVFEHFKLNESPVPWDR